MKTKHNKQEICLVIKVMVSVLFLVVFAMGISLAKPVIYVTNASIRPGGEVARGESVRSDIL